MQPHYYGLVPEATGFRPVFSSDLHAKFQHLTGERFHNPTLEDWIEAIANMAGIVAIADGLLHSGGKVVWVKPDAIKSIQVHRAYALQHVNEEFDRMLSQLS